MVRKSQGLYQELTYLFTLDGVSYFCHFYKHNPPNKAVFYKALRRDSGRVSYIRRMNVREMGAVLLRYLGKENDYTTVNRETN